MKYEILEHKADLKIRAFGKTKEELFLNMLLAMGESMKPELKAQSPRSRASTLRGREKRKVKITSPDLNSLLVDFLSEILYLSQVNKEVFFEAKFKKFSENEIDGEIFGQKVERFGEDIKAVTYHGLNVQQKENKTWEATVLFDV